MKKIYIAFVGLSLTSLAFLPHTAFAQWSGPSQAPTGGNTSAPINVGTTAQVKNGGLSVNAFTAWLNAYFAQNVGIGVVSPSYKLDIAGAGNGNVAARLTPDYGIVRLNGIDLLGYPSQDLWQIGNTSSVGFVLGTAWDWDRQIALRYSPGTIGAAGGLLTIGQTDKNNANYTHGATRFMTNGTERVRIDASGNVGIGATSPGADLEIYRDNTDAEIRFHDPSDAWYSLGIDVSDSRKFKLNYGSYAGENTHFVMDSSGNVGIGAASTGYKLDVNGDVINNGWFRSRGSTGWYNESYGGGWFMQDTTWIRAYNNKNVYTPGEIQAGTIRGNSYVCIASDCRTSWPSAGIGSESDPTVTASVKDGVSWSEISSRPAGLDDGDQVGITSESDTLATVVSRGNSAGAAIYAPAFYYSSDRVLKENIKPLSGSLDKVLRLRGVSFDWKDSGDESVGLVAQDVAEVFPELVSTDRSTGLSSVEYGNLVAPLIEAIREQQIEIDMLRREIESLKKNR